MSLDCDFNLQIKPCVHLSRIGSHPPIFAGKLANLVSVGVQITTINRKIDVMPLFVFFGVKNADAIRMNFRLPVKTLILQGIAHYLLHL